MLWRYYQQLENQLRKNRVLMIYGPRRAGKTTLLEYFLSNFKGKTRLDTGDNFRIQQLLSGQDFDAILEYAKGYDLIALDEAQDIPNVGKALKIIVDHIPNIHVIATGSSSLNLSHVVGEPLTGRKRMITLYPIAQLELAKNIPPFELKERLPEFLIFGSYPDVVLAESSKEKIAILNELAESYLFKDILAHEQLRNPQLLQQLVQLLAFQAGQLVSIHELATQLHVNVSTIRRYLDLLEKTFVIYRLGGFSSNPRKEISKKCKYYFYDNGIRNAVIGHFNPLSKRDDLGLLWENFLFMERVKLQSYKEFYGSRYFWRNYQGQEIDLIEQIDGELNAFEFKWSPKKKPQMPSQFDYPNTSFQVIDSTNYLKFITGAK